MPFIMSKPVVASAAPAQTRWRVFFLGAANYEAIWLAEIEMAATPGGANLCTGGSAFGTNNVGTLANLFDGNTGNYCNWVQAQADNSSAGYLFGTAVSIAEVRLTSASGFGARAPRAFVVQSSPDGTNWTTYAMHMGIADFGSVETKSFSVGATAFTTGVGRTNARGWRVNTTANNGAFRASIGELIMATSAGGTTICTGGGTTNNDIFVGNYAELAVDGNTATGWKANATNGTGRCGYLFPAAQDIAEVRMAPFSTNTTEAPKDFTIQYTEDGVTWTTAVTQTGVTGWANNAYKTFSV